MPKYLSTGVKLGNANTWSALQTFSAGLTVSGLYGTFTVNSGGGYATFTNPSGADFYIGADSAAGYIGTYLTNKPFDFIVNNASRARLNITGFLMLGGATSAASLLDLRTGDLTFSGANGQKYVQGRLTELVAVGSGLTTKATTIQIPADAIVYAVPVYVKTKPGGTATMTVTATTSGTAFQKGANISTNAGTSDPGTKATPVNYNSVAAQTVTFTFDAPTTDALGEIRVDIYYATSTPPTS